MNSRKIEKLLKNEGKKIVSSSSFNDVQSRVMQTKKYIEQEIKKEADSFVPNDVKSVRSKIEPKKKLYFRSLFTPKLVTAYSSIILTIVFAITIPSIIMNNNHPGSDSDSSSQIIPINPSPTKISVNSNAYDNGDSTFTSDIRLSCSIDDTGLTDTSTYTASSDISRMILALLAKDGLLNNDLPNNFLNNVVKKASNSSLLSSNTTAINISVEGTDTQYVSYLNQTIKDALESTLRAEGIDCIITINTNIANPESENAEITEKAIKLQEYAKYLFVMVGRDGVEFPISNFFPINDQQELVSLDFWIDFVTNKSSEYVDKYMTYFGDFIDGIQKDKDLKSFQNDLDYISSLYEERKTELTGFVDDYRYEIDALKEEYASTYGEKFLNDSAYDSYDITKDIDLASLSSVWWDNDFIDSTMDDLLNSDYNWWYGNDKIHGPKDKNGEGCGNGLDPFFSQPLVRYAPGGNPYDQELKDDIETYLTDYYDLKDLYKNNEIWFSLAFEIVKNANVDNNSGDHGDKKPYSGDNGYYHGDEDWNDYWYNYWYNNHGKGHHGS